MSESGTIRRHECKVIIEKLECGEAGCTGEMRMFSATRGRGGSSVQHRCTVCRDEKTLGMEYPRRVFVDVKTGRDVFSERTGFYHNASRPEVDVPRPSVDIRGDGDK